MTGRAALVLIGGFAGALVASAPPAAAIGDEGGGASIFERGELPSGEELRATVAGDVAISGKATACATCHGRSGLGSTEGRAWVPPVAGRILFLPRSSGRRARPGYDRESLARALREGVDSAGEPLDPLMPRYAIPDEAIDALASHLRTLSPSSPPGVTAKEIRFAVVSTPDAGRAARKATWEVLDAFSRNKNVQTRGWVPWDRNYGSFRKWVLVPWDLEGPPSGWGSQLRVLYEKAPVFALLSGAGGSEWGPVHEFCERRRIPAFLPNVDAPPRAAETGYYSVYFSLGVVLEAGAIAADLSGSDGPLSVLQVVADDGRARAGAAAVERLLPASSTFRQVELAAKRPGGTRSVRGARLRASNPPSRGAKRRRAVVLWLGADQVAEAFAALSGDGPWEKVYLSSTLTDGDPRGPSLPPGLDASVVPVVAVVHPFTEPSDLARRLPRIVTWLRAQGLPEDELRVRDQALTACMVVGDALMHALTEIDREYVLELLDHGGNAPSLSAFHARLAFGPGQRLLERSAFLLAVGPDAAPPRRVVP